MISVIIPTYKNKELFLNNLKNNLYFLKDCQVIVVNDDPEESLTSDFKKLQNSEKYKNITKNLVLIENKKNLGFGQAVNKGVREAKGKYLLFLNSDVVLFNDDFKKAIKYLKNDPTLFGVSFAQIEKDKKIVGKNKIYWYKGLIFHKKSNNLKFGINGWLDGGSCVIDKEKFNYLLGFDYLFSPFYWEDIDLSYRAHKAGFKVIFDPEIRVEHHHQTTINKYFTKEKIKTIAYRNQLIFILKNITQIKFICQFLFFLPYWLLFFLFKRDLAFIKGFFNFLTVYPKIIKQRAKNKKLFKINDETIFNKFS